MPQSSVEFTFSIKCNLPTNFSIKSQCYTTNHNKRITLFEPLFKGKIIKPNFIFSEQQIEFKHLHKIELEEENSSNSISPTKSLLKQIEKTISITNKTPISMSIKIDRNLPFIISQTNLSFESNEKKSLTIKFDPSFKTDFISETINQKLLISFPNHSQKYFLNLKGIIIFPNLLFNPSGDINFGNMLINTEQTKGIEIKNISELKADFCWELLPSHKNYDITKIFNIYPIRTTLEPNQNEVIHFSFFALSDLNGKSAEFNATAICHVKGGPEYVIHLNGGSASIKYKIDPLHIEFGSRNFIDNLNQKVTIQNLSDISISFKIKIPKNNKFQKLTIEPMEGIIQIQETFILNVNVLCGLPNKFNGSFIIQIGHYDDVRIDINVNCFIPQLYINLPRSTNDPLLKIYNENNENNNNINEEILNSIENKLVTKFINDKSLGFKKRILGKTINELPYIITNRYEINMGKIIFGQNESKTFIMKSKSNFPISFEINTNNLIGTGFIIEPTSFENVPFDTELQITIMFDTLKHNKEIIGEVELEIPIIFNNDLYTIINLKSVLEMPILHFSNLHFDFGNVIIGQSKLITLQIKNLNPINCEFSFSDAQYTNLIQRNINTTKSQQIFIANPSTGILLPFSTEVIEIIFAPKTEKLYSMQFPINIKYNNQPIYLTLQGTGIQLRITFEPNEIIIPPINAYSESYTTNFKIINPTNYPIEVIALQYDMQRLIDYIESKKLINNKNENENEKLITNNNLISNVSICIIINGPPISGKSTIAKIISEYLNIPIINLKEIFKDLIDKNEINSDEYIKIFSDLINQKDDVNGFIIDGLSNILQEQNTTQQFITHCQKQKNIEIELQKNPFYIIQHQNLTSLEIILNYIINSLDGHYIFQIALNINEDVLIEREEKQKSLIRKQKRIEQHQEKENLFNMTESQYENLNEEEKNIVDEKRQNVRNKLLQQAFEHDNNINKKSSRSTQRHNQKSNKNINNNKKKLDKTNNNKKKNQSQYYNNILLFNYTLGTITNIIQEENEHFKVIDPNEIITQKEENELNEFIKQNKNTILIDVSTLTLEQIKNIIINYIPKQSQIKEKSFDDFISTSKIFVNEKPKKINTLITMPKYFTIISDEIFEFPQQNNKSLRPDSHTVGRRSSKSTRRNSLIKELNINDYEINRRTPRWKIDSNSSKQLQIKFFGQNIGSYKDTILFSIINAKSEIFKLNVFAKCSYPEIDRNIQNIFPNKIRKFDPKSKFTYVIKTNEFYFGSLLICKEKPKNLQYKTSIYLTNVSTFPIDITSTFLIPKTSFLIETPQLTINPNEKGEIIFGINPLNAEIYKNQMIILIKDNPEPLIFNVLAEGCVPIIETSINEFDFGKLLIKQFRVLKLELYNNGKLSAYWHLKNTQSLADYFNINAIEGIIEPNESFIVEIKYCSMKTITIKKNIQLEVFDITKSKVFSTKSFPIFAESFDVSFDFQFPRGNDHLQFGQLKVNQEKQYNVTY